MTATLAPPAGAGTPLPPRLTLPRLALLGDALVAAAAPRLATGIDGGDVVLLAQIAAECVGGLGAGGAPRRRWTTRPSAGGEHSRTVALARERATLTVWADARGRRVRRVRLEVRPMVHLVRRLGRLSASDAAIVGSVARPCTIDLGDGELWALLLGSPLRQVRVAAARLVVHREYR